MDEKELKQKIRRLKRLELKIRYGFSEEYINKNSNTDKIDKLPLVWKEFFDLGSSGTGNSKARYSFNDLKQMDKDGIKRVFEEYWFFVYYRIYRDNGLYSAQLPQPELLEYLGLPYDADEAALKKRFRQLCKKYHPDEGGDPQKFIELMKIKEKYML